MPKSQGRTQCPPRDSVGVSYEGRMLSGDKSLRFPEIGTEVKTVLFTAAGAAHPA